VSGIEFPVLSLPSLFIGYNERLPFKEEFQLLIHNRKTLSCIQKFYYLRLSLKGDASQVIHSHKLTAENHTVAWDILQERYNNKMMEKLCFYYVGWKENQQLQ
jgi:hypothetical protein